MAPSKQDILGQVAEQSQQQSSQKRRGFLGRTAGVLGLAGGVGLTGRASATPDSVGAAKKQLKSDGAALLARLSKDGYLDRPSVGSLPEQRADRSTEQGMLTVESKSGKQTAFIAKTGNGTLEINLGGAVMDPYAIVRSADRGSNQIYLADEGGTYTVESFDGQATTDGFSTSQVADCDGCHCYARNNCWAADYVTVCSSVEDGHCVSLSDCGCQI